MSVSQVVQIGLDGMCKCSCADVCPLGKIGSETRCTKDELKAQGIETKQTEFACDFCLRKRKALQMIYTLHYKFGNVALCKKCYRKQRNRVR